MQSVAHASEHRAHVLRTLHIIRPPAIALHHDQAAVVDVFKRFQYSLQIQSTCAQITELLALACSLADHLGTDVFEMDIATSLAKIANCLNRIRSTKSEVTSVRTCKHAGPLVKIAQHVFTCFHLSGISGLANVRVNHDDYAPLACIVNPSFGLVFGNP